MNDIFKSIRIGNVLFTLHSHLVGYFIFEFFKVFRTPKFPPTAAGARRFMSDSNPPSPSPPPFKSVGRKKSDNWVQCDRCQKWRRLPMDVDTTKLPDSWYCDMNLWDHERNSCAAAEDVDGDKSSSSSSSTSSSSPKLTSPSVTAVPSSSSATPAVPSVSSIAWQG